MMSSSESDNEDQSVLQETLLEHLGAYLGNN